MVTQIPDYPEPTAQQEEIAEDSDLPAVAANPNLHIGPEGPHYWEQQSQAARLQAREDAKRFAIEAQAREEGRRRFAEEAAQEAKARAEWQAAAESAKPRVGTDAFVLPASPERSRGASPAVADTKKPAPAKIPTHDFKTTPHPTKSNASTSPTESSIAQRKPPTSAPSPKERKNAAQSLP